MKFKQYKIKLNKDGSLEALEPIHANCEQEGIVIFVDDEKAIRFDNKALLSESALKRVWDNVEDDIYNEL